MVTEILGVAEAKRRFSELIDRVKGGARFLVHRRGRPAVALVAPDRIDAFPRQPPLGLAAMAGALADWDELDEVVEEIYERRRAARDRPAPDLD